MPEYRIYTLGLDGHFVDVADIECADDQEAIKEARQTVDGRDVELWELGRFIAHLMPDDIELRERGHFTARLPAKSLPQ
jgi:hypothetical protein